MVQSSKGRVALISCAKNEGPWLLEWVAHHKVVGFDEIAIATNDCEDATAELASRLAELGHIHHIDNPPPYWEASDRIRIQATGYDRLQELPAIAACEWCMALDLDEFLVVHVNQGRVQDLVNYHRFPRPSSIIVRWRVFGDSGLEGYIEPPITDKLQQCAPSSSTKNFNFRSITRNHPRFAAEGHDGFRSTKFYKGRFPRTHRMLQYFGWVWVAFDRHRFPAPRALKKVWLKQVASQLQIGQQLSLAQINHYAVRTPSLVMLKARRGIGTGIRSGSRYDPRYYRRFNQNEAVDRSIAKYAKSRDRLLRQFLSDATVQQCYGEAARRTRAKLDECQGDLVDFLQKSRSIER